MRDKVVSPGIGDGAGDKDLWPRLRRQGVFFATNTYPA